MSDAVSAVPASIPDADYAAMRKLTAPMMEVAEAMTAQEIAAAMRGFYAASQTNCPWYAFGLRHSMPPILAVIGQGKDGYEEAWSASATEARRAETGTGSVEDESAVPEGNAP